MMPTSPNTSPTNEKDAASISEYRVPIWWSDGDSNPGPSACNLMFGQQSGIRRNLIAFPNAESQFSLPVRFRRNTHTLHTRLHTTLPIVLDTIFG
jgi:hypothetical protein